MGKKSARIAELEQRLTSSANTCYEETRRAARADDTAQGLLVEIDRLVGRTRILEDQLTTSGINDLKAERDRLRTWAATTVPTLQTLAALGADAAKRIEQMEALLAGEPVKTKPAARKKTPREEVAAFVDKVNGNK